MSETTRLLLPFTHGVEMDTIEAAVLLAASHQATLVPLALILVPQTRGKGARLEHIQQSKDFLEAAQNKALRHGVPLERFEVFTSDVLQSIAVLVHELSCDGVVLAYRGRNGSLLHAKTIEQLLAMRCLPALPSVPLLGGVNLGVAVTRALLPLAVWTAAARRQARPAATGVRRAGIPGSGVDPAWWRS